jgi:hypothetical protein
MMIPEIGTAMLDEPLVSQQQPSQTWKLDFDKGRVTGRTDGLDAVKQAVFKMLQTDRFWHAVYNFDYGHELKLLIGSSPVFVESEAKRMIEEALIVDDRIESISSVDVEITGDQMLIRFTVQSVYGSFDAEVSSNV